jgi:chloramphenicol O-acetyltransferase
MLQKYKGLLRRIPEVLDLKIQCLESISQFILEIKDGFDVYSKNVVKMTKVVKTNEKVVNTLEPESDEEEEFSDNLSDYISEQINEMKD